MQRMALGLMAAAVLGCGDDVKVAAPPMEMRQTGFARDEATSDFRNRPAEEPSPATATFAAGNANPQSAAFQIPTQMIIRTGAVSIEVDSVEQAVARVTDLAARSGGLVANASLQTGENEVRSATLEVKVPADRYDATLDGLRAVGEVKNSSTTSQDVGEEFVDVSARVTNAKRLEDRLITLLATRTGKLEDVLNVERELARVREEIERYEGRLRYLKAKVAMSTIVVSLFEPGPLLGQPGDHPILDAFSEAWRNFVGVIAGTIAVAGGLIPLFVLVVVVLWLGRRWWKKQQAPAA